MLGGFSWIGAGSSRIGTRPGGLGACPAFGLRMHRTKQKPRRFRLPGLENHFSRGVTYPTGCTISENQ